MQNHRNPQNTEIISGYTSFDHVETAETGHRIKSQSNVRARPKTFAETADAKYGDLRHIGLLYCIT